MMPKLVIRYVIPETKRAELVALLVRAGGRGGMRRTAELLGLHRNTLLNALKRGAIGQRVGTAILDAFSHVEGIKDMLVLTIDE